MRPSLFLHREPHVHLQAALSGQIQLPRVLISWSTFFRNYSRRHTCAGGAPERQDSDDPNSHWGKEHHLRVGQRLFPLDFPLAFSRGWCIGLASGPQEHNRTQNYTCAVGDTTVDDRASLSTTGTSRELIPRRCLQLHRGPTSRLPCYQPRHVPYVSTAQFHSCTGTPFTAESITGGRPNHHSLQL